MNKNIIKVFHEGRTNESSLDFIRGGANSGNGNVCSTDITVCNSYCSSFNCSGTNLCKTNTCSDYCVSNNKCTEDTCTPNNNIVKPGIGIVVPLP